MTETTPAPQPQQNDMKQYYVLGFIVLVAVIVAGYLLMPKQSATTTTPVAQTENTPVATPTPGPITALSCDTQYYNPVIGFPKYYLSVEGGDVSPAAKVDCTFTVSAANKVVATETTSSPLTEKPQRGGSTFRCTTKALDLTPNVPTKVDVALKDDAKGTSSCSAIFLLPTP